MNLYHTQNINTTGNEVLIHHLWVTHWKRYHERRWRSRPFVMNLLQTHNAINIDNEELIPLSWTYCTPKILAPQAMKYSSIIYESHTTNVTTKDDEELVPLLWTCHTPRLWLTQINKEALSFLLRIYYTNRVECEYPVEGECGIRNEDPIYREARIIPSSFPSTRNGSQCGHTCFAGCQKLLPFQFLPSRPFNFISILPKLLCTDSLRWRRFPCGPAE